MRLSVSMQKTYEEIAQVCACFHLRRASRCVTGLYDRSLKAEGLTSSQFVLLLVLILSKDSKMTETAEVLGMDRTSLTRLIRPLVKRNLVTTKAVNDRRAKILSLTPKGKSALHRAIPLWKSAQSNFDEVFGREEWLKMVKKLNKVYKL
jgi:DNA-binding MarR family transcriptional regulator